ncbi:MAG: hypothetical protein P4M00_05035 [Azospirillaceae bacterium]|nr:hypothetical protein [Azospirillaceae bacterium]
MVWIAVSVVFVTLVVGAATACVVAYLREDFRRCGAEASLRHAQAIKRLTDSLMILQREQQEAQRQIQALSTINRKLIDDLGDLQDRLDDTGSGHHRADDRVLH